MWLAAEEEGFGRTLEQGMEMLREQIERARDARRAAVPAEDVFTLHDTYGFPYEMTSELLAEEGLAIEGDFEELMERAARARPRRRARGGAGGGHASAAAARARSTAVRPTRFTGYETEEQQTTVVAVRRGSTAPRRERRRAGERARAAGQARRVAVLRRRRRPGLRRRHDRMRATATAARASRTSFRSARTRCSRWSSSAGTLRAGEPVLARVDHLRQARDRVQPHRHPPAAGGAARAPRQPRAPGRLLRRARTSCASTSATARR